MPGQYFLYVEGSGRPDPDSSQFFVRRENSAINLYLAEDAPS
jgi:hypothetical protein